MVWRMENLDCDKHKESKTRQDMKIWATLYIQWQQVAWRNEWMNKKYLKKKKKIPSIWKLREKAINKKNLMIED